jgi:hypothetical protein
MDFDNIEKSLEKYLEAIGITKGQDAKIKAALGNVLSLMLMHYPEAKVYAQGSYATDTMVKPLTAHQGKGKAGEFDIDIAIENEWDGAGDALDEIASILKDDETFKSQLIDNTKNTCVRVEYADDDSGVSFHIDLVPTKASNSERYVADREADEWKQSDAKQFAEWFNRKADEQPELRNMAVIIKRLRDLAGLTDNIKSILILSLVVAHYYENGTKMGNLVNVFDGIQLVFSGSAVSRLVVPNPVNDGENLVDGIKNYSAAHDFFVNTASTLKDAIAEDDAEALKQLFGPGFTYEATEKVEAVSTSPRAVEPTRAYGASDATTEKG